MLSLGATVSVSLMSRSPISNDESESECFLLDSEGADRPRMLPTMDPALDPILEGALDGGGEGALLWLLLVCLDVELCFDTWDRALDLLE